MICFKRRNIAIMDFFTLLAFAGPITSSSSRINEMSGTQQDLYNKLTNTEDKKRFVLAVEYESMKNNLILIIVLLLILVFFIYVTTDAYLRDTYPKYRYLSRYLGYVLCAIGSYVTLRQTYSIYSFKSMNKITSKDLKLIV